MTRITSFLAEAAAAKGCSWLRPALAGVLVVQVAMPWAQESPTPDPLEGPYENCGTLANHYGPFDYFAASSHTIGGGGSKSKIGIVEVRHLTPQMLQLKRGSTAEQIRQDLDYTLRAVPNHPMALDLASRFEERRRESSTFAKRQRELILSADCYFKRALMLTPRNSNVWMLYGLHAHREGNYRQAVERYAGAEKLGMNSASFHYNYGLSLLELGRLDEAKLRAERAMAMGYPFTGLRDRLAERGVEVAERQ